MSANDDSIISNHVQDLDKQQLQHTHRSSLNQQPSEPENEEDFNLEDAIGDVFNQFDFKSEQHQDTRTNILPQRRHIHTPTSSISSSFQSDKIRPNSHESTEEEHHNEQLNDSSNKFDESNQDTNLEDAIGDVFENMFQGSDDNDNKQAPFKEVSGGESITSPNATSELRFKAANPKEVDNNDNNDDDLNDAIGNVFDDMFQDKNPTGPTKEANSKSVIKNNPKINTETEYNSNEVSKNDEKNNTNSFESKSYDSEPVSEEGSKMQIPLQAKEEEQDDNLDDAIGNAFDSILNESNQNSVHDSATSKSHNDKLNDTINDVMKEVDTTNIEALNNSIVGESQDVTQVAPQDVTQGVTQDVTQDVTQGESQADNSINQVSDPNQKQLNSTDVDEELNNAIGDAFKGMFENTQEEPKKLNVVDQDEDLENAIGNAFSGIFEKQQNVPETMSKAIADENNRDLDNAIGSAFQNILKDEKESSDDVIENAFNNILHQEKQNQLQNNNVKSHIVGDDELNEIVSQSFNTVFQSQPQLPKHEIDDLEDVISQAFKSAMSVQQQKPQNDLSKNLVQNIVDHIPSTTNTNITNKKEKYVKKLAVEISHQVQDHLSDDFKKRQVSTPKQKVTKHSNIPGLPRLDDSVLAHFQKESSVQPMTQVFETAADLDQLQMNDILQNAFKMALDNPNELISDLDFDESPKSKPVLESKVKPVVAHKQPPLIPQGTINKTPVVKEPLVIEPEKVRPSLLSNPAVTSQLTSVISSLTSRINSGELSNANILSVIRQMTEELASGGSLAPFLKKPINIDDVVAGYKGEENLQFIRILKGANSYLDKNFSENGASMKLIQNIISKFDPDNENEDLIEFTKEETLEIAQLFNFIIDLIVKYSSPSRFHQQIASSLEQFKLNGVIQESITSTINKPLQQQLKSDMKLNKLIKDLYNLFAGSSLLDNSQPMVISTCISIACGMHQYKTNECQINDLTEVVQEILISVFENTPGMTNYKDSPMNKDKLHQLLLSTNKRKSDLLVGNGDYKKRFLQPSLESSYLNTSLKMPSYRKSNMNDKTNSLVKPSLKLPRNSPFLSNKLKSSSSSSSGLKKPGSFQKPNEKHKASSLGFPRLFSTNF